MPRSLFRYAALRRAVAAFVACALGPLACADRPAGPSAGAGDGASPLADLGDEAGFFDVPPQAGGAQSAGRMFYVFERADADAEHKPLAVFFAGGPGYGASLDLLPFGTARATLDAFSPLGGAPAPNLARWTSFANLLFVDERQAGFSYDVAPDAAATATDSADGGACSFSPIGDAADFVRALLHFLDGHPPLQTAPVILVGQSYGGERATLVLDLLLRYSTEAARADGALASEIQAHYDAVFPSLRGKVVSLQSSRSQFGRLVLLQPLVLGGAQYAAQAALAPVDPYVGQVSPAQDPYDVRQPAGWTQAFNDRAASALADLDAASQLLAVDPRAIPRLGPASRANAFRPDAPAATGAARMNDALTAALGPLRVEDHYMAYPSTACPVADGALTGAGSADEFVANLRDGVMTFLTDARYDSVIYAPAIPEALKSVAGAVIDATDATDARPGRFAVTFPVAGTPGVVAAVRFPAYANSGHFVAVTEAQALHDDVADWLAKSL